MLLPTLSVTAIGLVVGLVGAIGLRRLSLGCVGWSLAGAWAGFLAGGVPGVLVDVVLGTGVWLAVIGHGGAVVGAVFALRHARNDTTHRTVGRG